MIEKRPADGLGTSSFNGADTIHHFCFGPYQSPDRINWGSLRMLNRIQIKPRGGREPNYLGGMEIVLFVEKGSIDVTCGSDRLPLCAGEFAVLAMRTGADFGFCNYGTHDAEVIEIWIQSGDARGAPIARRGRSAKRTTLASEPTSAEVMARLQNPATVSYVETTEQDADPSIITANCYAYVLVLEGTARLGDMRLHRNDAAALSLELAAPIVPQGPCKYILIES